jgi:hypothetical protein
MKEEWKLVPGFADYEVSSLGRLRSLNPRKGSRANINGGIICGWVQTVRSGYQRRLVALRGGGQTHIRKIHRLVLEAFVGPCPEGMVALHYNGDALDNRLENLRWGTQAENVGDSIRHGIVFRPPVQSGEKHHNATLSSKDIATIRAHVFKRGDQASFARKYGVADITIRRIRRGLSRQHG